MTITDIIIRSTQLIVLLVLVFSSLRRIKPPRFVGGIGVKEMADKIEEITTYLRKSNRKTLLYRLLLIFVILIEVLEVFLSKSLEV